MSRRSLGIWDFAAAVFDDDQQQRGNVDKYAAALPGAGRLSWNGPGGGSPGFPSRAGGKSEGRTTKVDRLLVRMQQEAARAVRSKPHQRRGQRTVEVQSIATAATHTVLATQVKTPNSRLQPHDLDSPSDEDEADGDRSPPALTPVRSLLAPPRSVPYTTKVEDDEDNSSSYASEQRRRIAQPSGGSRGGQTSTTKKPSGSRRSHSRTKARTGSRLGLPYHRHLAPDEIVDDRGPAWQAHRAALANSGGTAEMLQASGRRMATRRSGDHNQILEPRPEDSSASTAAVEALLESPNPGNGEKSVGGWGALWIPSAEDEGFMGTAQRLEEEANAGLALPWTRLDSTAGGSTANPAARSSALDSSGKVKNRSNMVVHTSQARPASVADDLLVGNAKRRPQYAQPLRRPRTQGSPGRSTKGPRRGRPPARGKFASGRPTSAGSVLLFSLQATEPETNQRAATPAALSAEQEPLSPGARMSGQLPSHQQESVHRGGRDKLFDWGRPHSPGRGGMRASSPPDSPERHRPLSPPSIGGGDSSLVLMRETMSTRSGEDANANQSVPPAGIDDGTFSASIGSGARQPVHLNRSSKDARHRSSKSLSELSAAVANAAARRQAEVVLKREAAAEARRRTMRRADNFFRTGRCAARLKPMMKHEVVSAGLVVAVERQAS